ncbi:MAG: hypothetical protein GY742_10075 [Hyphomicrobiales bacterium]|nr:hypothetical protein [Hyphomicrobiales bacterium]
MKYESFDRIEIVHMQGEFRARWIFGVPGYHKRNSTLQVDNFDRPVYHIFSTASIADRVPHIGPSALLRSLPDAQASRYAPRLAEWTDMGHQTVHISSNVL